MAGWSAGTDCIAFVQNSAGYNNSPYHYINLGGGYLGNCFWGDSRGTTRYPHENNGCWTISQRGNTANLNKVVPGDIFYTGADHIAIVKSIEYVGNTRTTDIGRIYLIEATFGRYEGDRFGKVINFWSINYYNNVNWVIARLRIDN